MPDTNDIFAGAGRANGAALAVAEVPSLPLADFLAAVTGGVAAGLRVAAFFGQPLESGGLRLWAILASEARGRWFPLRTDTAATSYPSLTPACPELHWFERELGENWGVEPVGHPWLKPIRFSPPRRGPRPGAAARPAIGDTSYFQVAGEEVHEVAVGPVHAGIIEPGHFRFQCHGEQVLHLEISLGYQHRGVERNLVGGPDHKSLHLAETLCGDSTVAHATAYCQALEALGHGRAPARAQALRGVALELERIANHVGDLGALAGDVGFLPTLSFCGRLRGDVLNLTGLICGNRFGRRLLKPGGVGYDLDPELTAEILARLAPLTEDLTGAVELLWDAASVMARFEGAGRVSAADARALGLVGPPARAAGLERDVRADFPAGIYQFAQIPVSTGDTGDVSARAKVRWLEILRSLAFVREQLAGLPQGEVLRPPGPPAPESLAVSLVEGWRGEVCHVAVTGGDGRFAAYKVVDPSFHNWFGLALALRDQEISDFPLCNKSFNLSYCGHDL
ncbi:MAG: NADH-quinone oxidoreductase subunit C [Deltaproteobacteria bacterium]|nr:NADH-quinone oxidoreductase subunit C [Deltaproteobacteria bacterium]